MLWFPSLSLSSAALLPWWFPVLLLRLVFYACVFSFSSFVSVDYLLFYSGD
uniref:Uncharacterized protein n=1 Tax=Triticum urartu TaxID=4572 RepID=A0A8R7Q6U2_TRIUA